MQQELRLNIIPFTAPIKEAEFSFYQERIPDSYPVFKNDLNGLLTFHFSDAEIEKLERLYTDFQPPKEGALVLNINLTENPRFANHYFRYLIRQYFTGVADIMHQNFTSETEVWFLDSEIINDKFSVYNQFMLKVQHGRVTDKHELVVSYDGTTKVLKKPVSQIYNFKTELFNWIAFNGILYKWKYRPQEVINQPEKCFPVVSNTLKPHFEIAFDVPVLKNRYPKYYKILQDFYTKHLDTDTFRNIIPLSVDGFYSSVKEQTRIISPASNDLLYSHPNTGKEPKKDFKYKGPYQLPKKPSNFKFFFIYQASDKKGAVTELYRYLHSGYKDEKFPFPRMQDYIKIPFELDITKNIEFDEVKNAVTTVRNAVKNADWLPDTQYMALFVNPVPKLEKDEARTSIYYKIKEILLYEDVLSQVIKSEHLLKNGQPNKYFNTFLPHIEIAMLAKLGGIPWKLNRPPVNELIVGVGAFYSVTQKTRFVGSAFCFNNEGMFKGFDCFKSNDTYSLAGSIREAVGKFIVTNHTAKRLVIHFYKDISKKELEPIIKTLHALGLPIPVIVVTINKTESKELLGFDMKDPDNLMPYSGTILKVGKSEYLLFNNTRYEPTSKPAQKEYHFPVKIALSCTVKGMLDDMDLVEQLIDQVYQFSRMYWKSTDQQSLPVTIKYPEMVASIYPYFHHDKLPDFGKENLWFL
ncbi:MAG: Piwi domain-containing protein [Lentimicrobiaceae bacterium]|jgi:hypothetical protein